MKTNELMIGDLLKWKEQPGFNDEDRNTVLRVKNILDDAIKIDGQFELYHISLFEPIPLTLEILEKNGWSQEVYSNVSYDNEDIECLSLWVGEDGKNAWWWHVGCELVIPINYVHEFQQALRLCGIDKEIEL